LNGKVKVCRWWSCVLTKISGLNDKEIESKVTELVKTTI
jgi:hypothetical protein